LQTLGHLANISEKNNNSVYGTWQVLLTLPPHVDGVFESTDWHASRQYYGNSILKVSR